MESNDLEQWSRFWQQGFITTFGAKQANNYDGVVRNFWVDHFLELPAGTRILDIATGNGAIATLAAEVGDKYDKNFFVAATDLAAINSEIIVDSETSRLREKICFHSHTPCERQPFEDAYFDFVSSQFGFEYSNIELTIREIRRVLAPGGKFISIAHHVDSRLIKSSRDELDVYHSALDELDLFGNFREYLAALGDPNGSPQKLARAMRLARPLSQRINTVMDSFRQRHPDDECGREIVNAISHLARSARNTNKAKLFAAVRAAEQEFQFARARIRDMIGASLGEEQIDTLAQTARVAGFESVRFQEFYGEDGGLAGWQIHVR